MQISEIERTTKTTAPSLVFGTPGREDTFLRATVEQDDTMLYVSRYDHETQWVIDGLWRGCFPVFHNGEGSRCTIPRHPDAEIQTALDAAALREGLLA